MAKKNKRVPSLEVALLKHLKEIEQYVHEVVAYLQQRLQSKARGHKKHPVDCRCMKCRGLDVP